MTVAEDLMRAMVQGVTLETMARHLVGDGGSPNMFFVTTSDDKVTAVFTDLARAKQYAETFGLWRIEDRQTGEVWACGRGSWRPSRRLASAWQDLRAELKLGATIEEALVSVTDRYRLGTASVEALVGRYKESQR